MDAETRTLRCMEIWGGNTAEQRALRVPGLDVWIYCQPCASPSGGDLHYISTCGAGKIARFVVADVAGHGADVSRLARFLRKIVRRNINTLDQRRFVRALNSEFQKVSDQGRFATAVLASYYAPSEHLVVCNAGHPRPLWYHAATGQWRALRHDETGVAERVHNLPLGIVDPTQYYQFAVKLEKGDLVLLYTDALPEARDPHGHLLGEAGLIEMLASLPIHPLETYCTRLMAAVREFRGGEPLEDDATLMFLHHNETRGPRQSLGEVLRVLGKVTGLIRV
jgi:serine phosphatase RsbU (regulator of sigma subunit)